MILMQLHLAYRSQSHNKCCCCRRCSPIYATKAVKLYKSLVSQCHLLPLYWAAFSFVHTLALLFMANKGPLSATQKRVKKSEIVVRVYRTYVPYSLDRTKVPQAQHVQNRRVLVWLSTWVITWIAFWVSFMGGEIYWMILTDMLVYDSVLVPLIGG